MEPEPSEHGHNFSLRDFLHALRKRGRDEAADKYESKFLSVYCPPLKRETVLRLPFNDLCSATSLLQKLFVSPSHDQTRVGSNFRYGTWYLNKMGAGKQ